MHRFGFTPGDIWGGLAASAVVLPQAMAFGVALLVVNGFDASQGAIAGLLGAAILCIVSGLFSGAKGLISAPTGPVLVLLGGALASLSAQGVSGNTLLLNLAIIIMCTGVFQIIIGITGGGNLVKYIPYPVVSGFLTGSAILMILSQMDPVTGQGFDTNWQSWRWLPFLTAIATIIFTYIGPKYIKKLPGTIAGLLFGTIVFHILASFNTTPLPTQWLIGELPSLDAVGVTLSFDELKELHWKIIIPSALALAILTSLDTLLTAVIADVTTGLRHNANLEMIGQGIGQILTSFFGGMAAAGTTGATVVAVNSGGRRWVGVFAGITFLILIFIARDVGSILPISVLAGIILSVSLHMIDLDIFAWLKHARTRSDAMIALFVTIVTVAYDLMVAVGIGVFIAIVLFIRSQIQAPVVHRRSTGANIRSNRNRSLEERELLEKHGERIILYELRGNLFFAKADALLDELAQDLNSANFVILHMRRVLQIDLTATKYIQQIASRLNQHDGQLIFCNVHKEIGLGKKVQKRLKKITVSRLGVQILTFNGRDEALEYAENALLEDLGVTPTRFKDCIALHENDLCRELNIEEQKQLESVLKTKVFGKNETLFKRGDHGNEIYMIKSGQVEIRLPTTKHHYKRLSTCQPGSFFGELSLLNPGPRTADAVATHKTELYILDRDSLDELGQTYPRTLANLLMMLAKIQVDYLRWSTKEIQHLSKW